MRNIIQKARESKNYEQKKLQILFPFKRDTEICITVITWQDIKERICYVLNLTLLYCGITNVPKFATLGPG